MNSSHVNLIKLFKHSVITLIFCFVCHFFVNKHDEIDTLGKRFFNCILRLRKKEIQLFFMKILDTFVYNLIQFKVFTNEKTTSMQNRFEKEEKFQRKKGIWSSCDFVKIDQSNMRNFATFLAKLRKNKNA